MAFRSVNQQLSFLDGPELDAAVAGMAGAEARGTVFTRRENGSRPLRLSWRHHGHQSIAATIPISQSSQASKLSSPALPDI